TPGLNAPSAVCTISSGTRDGRVARSALSGSKKLRRYSIPRGLPRLDEQSATTVLPLLKRFGALLLRVFSLIVRNKAAPWPDVRRARSQLQERKRIMLV